MRSISRSDSRLTTMPAAIACASSASVLPGPAKLIAAGAMPEASATLSSPAEATSSPSTRLREMLHHRRHRIGLDRVVQVHFRRQVLAQQLDALR